MNYKVNRVFSLMHILKSTTCLLLLTTFVVTSGCTGADNEKPQQQNKTKKTGKIQLELKNFISPLETSLERYQFGIQNGSVINQQAFEKSKKSLEKASQEWDNQKKSIIKARSKKFAASMENKLDNIKKLVSSKGSVQEVKAIHNSLLNTLTRLQTRDLPKTRQGIIRSINKADRKIEAETTARNYRIGVALVTSRTIYKDGEIVSDTKGKPYQLQVILRQKQSKRKLPGSSVKATFVDKSGNTVEQANLLETWGDYHFYGKNLEIPNSARSLKINASPPLVGRHEDMKDLFVDSVSSTFDLKDQSNQVTIAGSELEPVKSNIQPGSDVSIAAEESLRIKENSPYKVGFIPEHSEPFWVFTQHQQGKQSPDSLKMADVPQTSNRHLEIALFEEKSYRIVPHAEIHLNVKATNKEARAKLNLHFLLSAFNHYGNSLYLPDGQYKVEASIKNPDIHTLEPGEFSDNVKVSFNWSPNEKAEAKE